MTASIFVFPNIVACDIEDGLSEPGSLRAAPDPRAPHKRRMCKARCDIHFYRDAVLT